MRAESSVYDRMISSFHFMKYDNWYGTIRNIHTYLNGTNGVYYYTYRMQEKISSKFIL